MTLTRSAARTYINKIRNPEKRRYAEAWFQHIYHGAAEPVPPADLSYMAAQAVRLEIGPRKEPEHPTPGTRTATNDVSASAHEGEVEILVFNGECNGAYLSPETAIEVAEEIIAVAKSILAHDDRRRGE